MSLTADLRHAGRMMRLNPGFAAAVVLTLGLGIGATTAMFTVVDGVLLKPLRYPGADRIVAASTVFTDRGRAIPRLTGGDFLDLRADRQTFESIASYYGGAMGVQIADRAEFAGAVLVDTEFTSIFGMPPLYGRLFNVDDAQRSAVVSLPFAVRNFGSGDRAIAQPLHLEDRTYTIVGVLPPSFQFPEATDVWIAGDRDPQNLERTAYNYRVVARLREGVTVAVANSRLAALSARLATAYPASNTNKTFTVKPLRDQLVAPVRTTLIVLMGAVGLLLLIACANVANLMLARASARGREIAVRAALGATRWQIVRQMLAESLVLALAAGVLGVMIATIGTNLLLWGGAATVPLPRLADVSIDWRVLLFAVAVCCVSSVGFGLAPAYQASRVNLSEALKRAGARGVLGNASGSLRTTLVVAQIALSLVLVIGAGLLFRSFLTLMSVQLGFRTDAVLVMYAHAPARTLDDYVRVTQFEQELFENLRQVPGIASVAGAMGLPTGQYGSNGGYAIEGQGTMQHHAQELPHAEFSLASPGYFSTMGIPRLRGRDFTDADRYGSQPAAIVSEALARQSFGDADPLGRRIQCGLDGESMQWMTIVGIVGNVRQDSPASPAAPALYMPLAQHPFRANEVQVVMRTQGEPLSFRAPVEQIVRGMNPAVAMKFTTMEAMVGDSVAAPRFRTSLSIAFAALALLLAMTGVYAVMSYVTVQRTSEFAIRAALGGSRAAILRLVLGGAARVAGMGVVAGVVLAVTAGRVLATMLFGMAATDMVTYGIVLALVLPTILLAAAVPALRASRVDPLAALRTE
ncbi:MAG: putative transport system permease protein [Acidobacteriota bacterium]|jgi:predicted permease